MPGLKASILIVEDEESVRASLAEILKVLGHRVRCAADGLAALVEMNQEIPEILLSDLNMPGMSGFELLPLARIIREDRSEGVSGDMASPRRLLSA